MVRTDGWTGKDLVLYLVTRALLISRIAFLGNISNNIPCCVYEGGGGFCCSNQVRIIIFLLKW